MANLPNILATRLNFDVIAFRGCTRYELMVIALISLGMTLMMSVLVTFILFHSIIAGLGIAFPLSIAVGWCLTGILQKQKQGKPKGYIKQRLQLWLEDKGLKPSPFIRYSGVWNVRRNWLN